ncbi:amino acid ABC transporter permease, partial [Enterococcus faecalis]|nr:amino acid ABC transporter permease [Enterococcus faecalis]
MLTLLTVTPQWYKDLMTFIPEGKIFNLRAVFDGIPQILAKLPITIGLTLGGAAFGLFLGLIFAIVKINKVPVLYRI